MKDTATITALTAQQLDWCHRTISSDALAAITLHNLATETPCSIVRAADGEQCIIAYAHGAPLRRFLTDPDWLVRFGMPDTDLKQVAENLIRAGNEATYYAPSISGLYKSKYNLYQYFQDRQEFADVFYHREWKERGWLDVMLPTTNLLVLHGQPERVKAALIENFGCRRIETCEVHSWKDHDAVRRAVEKSTAQLVLGSVGPVGKYLLVELARDYGKVVLDVGNGMLKSWCKSITAGH